MGDDTPQCVKVAIRMRPPSKKEIDNGEAGIVELVEAFGPGADPGQVILNDPSGSEEPASFAFDIVFGLTIQQFQVYENIGRPALMKTFEGFNGTIFAYGQTGSGKSWSMAGAQGELRGITPRVCEELFERIKEMVEGSTRRFLVMCSYFEIYNEIIFDLLNPVQDRSKLGGGLQVKEHPALGIYVKDLTEIVAEDAKKLEEMLDNGMKARAVSSTMMNSVSSRSHSVFTIKVHQKDEEDKSKNVFAKLNLVDLAGSERQKGTGATGQTLKEGANINKSLSALGNVINALVDSANGKKVFIPYRNSKLTRVLQESLGGNSLTSMLATLSPAACNYDETMSTLRYANRAKSIKVSATKNEEASQISRLKAEVEELKKKLANSGSGGGGGAGGLSEAEREAEKEKFEKQLKEMEEMMSNNWQDKAKLSEEHERKMQKVAEEQRKAAQAVEEERARRLRLLQEKNDLELSIRGLIDLVTSIPKLENPPPLLTGEQPRQWLKAHRSLRQGMDELKEQRTMVLVFKHAFDEDVRLVGEGAEANDINTTYFGLNRCLPKLEKLRKGAEKLQQLEGQSLAISSELSEAIRQATAELAKYQQALTEEAEAANDVEGASAEGSAGKAKRSALEEASRMLGLVQKQVKEKTDELEQLSTIEMGPTCDVVMQSSSFCQKDGGSAAEEVKQNCQALQAVLEDPSIAAVPAGMPTKPLREYQPTEVQDTPESTEAVLGQIIRWEGLCGGKSKKSAAELLARPPPKFILDVALAVKAATGFPANVEGDWPEAREERLARFKSIADTVGAVLSFTPDFDPADVLKGKEVPKTLRLMQLLAVAAARQQPPESKKEAPSGGTAKNGSAKKGHARPRELQPMLDAVSRVLQATKTHVEAKRAESAAAAQGEQSLEEKIALLERQMEEESSSRRMQEETLANAERQLQESRAEMKKISNECELLAEVSPEQAELEKQLASLQEQSLADLPVPEVLKMLQVQVEEIKRSLEQDEGEVAELEERQQELVASVKEAEAHARELEAEVQRERQKEETKQELMGQSPEEQKVILEAHEQKLRTKAEALEEQITQMQAEAEERTANNLKLGQETHELQAKAEDAHLQMQIVQEERDAMREAMEQLWIEKSTIDEELTNLNHSYINLTENLQTQEAEYGELEQLFEQRRDQVAALQKNGFDMLRGAVSAAA